MSNIGVAIGTFGDRDFWAPLVERALQSVFSQSQQPMVKWVHHDTLHEARNAAAKKLMKQGADWLVFLDADDELERDYILNMSLAASISDQITNGAWPVFYPATRAIVDDVADRDIHLHTPGNLIQQNFVNIGAMHKSRMFDMIGGFDDWPVLEDWAYWTKAWVMGAEYYPVGGAVYRAYIDNQRPGRNKQNPVIINETCSNIRAMYSFLAKKQGLI